MSENLPDPVIIPLATGVELVIHPEQVTSEISEQHIERVRTLFDRTALVAEIRAVVNYIFEHGGDEAVAHLERILEVAGWHSCRSDHDDATFAATINMLVEHIISDDLDRLANVLDEAEIAMHKIWARREAENEEAEGTGAELARWGVIGAKLRSKNPEHYRRVLELARPFLQDPDNDAKFDEFITGIEALAAGGAA